MFLLIDNLEEHDIASHAPYAFAKTIVKLVASGI